jgi:hypothetical protein
VIIVLATTGNLLTVHSNLLRSGRHSSRCRLPPTRRTPATGVRPPLHS